MKKNFKQEAEKSGYKVYCNEDVIANVPQPMKGKVELFTLGRYISDDELEKEYSSRGLVPADPFSVLKVAKESDKYIGTHWKDKNGKWCFSAFNGWDDGRDVSVYRDGIDWDDGWWFAGLRKSSAKSSKSQSFSDTRLQDFVSELKALLAKYDK